MAATKNPKTPQSVDELKIDKNGSYPDRQTKENHLQLMQNPNGDYFLRISAQAFGTGSDSDYARASFDIGMPGNNKPVSFALRNKEHPNGLATEGAREIGTPFYPYNSKIVAGLHSTSLLMNINEPNVTDRQANMMYLQNIASAFGLKPPGDLEMATPKNTASFENEWKNLKATPRTTQPFDERPYHFFMKGFDPSQYIKDMEKAQQNGEAPDTLQKEPSLFERGLNLLIRNEPNQHSNHQNGNSIPPLAKVDQIRFEDYSPELQKAFKDYTDPRYAKPESQNKDFYPSEEPKKSSLLPLEQPLHLTAQTFLQEINSAQQQQQQPQQTSKVV